MVSQFDVYWVDLNPTIGAVHNGTDPIVHDIPRIVNLTPS